MKHPYLAITILVAISSTVCLVAQEDGSLRWAAPLGGEVSLSSPAVAPDGTIYMAGISRIFRAINPDGTPKWELPIDHHMHSSPAIGADGTIYVGSNDGNLYAIDPDTEMVKAGWPFFTGARVDSSPAIGADGTIYVGSWNHNLYAIKPDGTAKADFWPFETDNIVESSPAIGADDTIYVGSVDGHLYAIYPNGSQKWVFPDSGFIGGVESSPAIGFDGTIYVGSDDGNVYAIYPNGSQKWVFSTTGLVRSSPAIGPDGAVYVGALDKFVYAIDSDTGTPKAFPWPFPAPGVVGSSPAIGADGTIYVGFSEGGGPNNGLLAINPDGTQKWVFPRPEDDPIGTVPSSPAIGADGTIYVGSNDGNLYAIYGSSGGLASSAWPMFHHDLRHTGRVNQSPLAQCQDVTQFTGELCQGTVSPGEIDNGSSDPDGDAITFSLDPAGPFILGDTPVTLTVTDEQEAFDSCTATVTILDQTPPSLMANSPIEIPTDGSCEVSLPDLSSEVTGMDACTPEGSLVISQNPVAGTLLGVGDHIVTLTVTDESENSTNVDVTVSVLDTIPPVVSMTAANPNPVAVDNPFVVTAVITDQCTSVVSAEFSLDGGTTFNPMDPITTPAPVVNPSVTVSAITEPDILTVCVRGTDESGNVSDPECILLPVYDPEGGFVTGGGWIQSPAGAYTTDPSLTGKANFGFVSKYQKGANTPTGQTQFRFKVADLNFHSDSYDWLVVANAKAMYKGTGSVNGEAGYNFMLSAIDGDLKQPTPEPDRFRIRIWQNGVIYDNQLGDSDDDDPTTTLGGGSIVIHEDN